MGREGTIVTLLNTAPVFAQIAAFNVTETTAGSRGVILVNYERAGAVQTGRQSTLK